MVASRALSGTYTDYDYDRGLRSKGVLPRIHESFSIREVFVSRTQRGSAMTDGSALPADPFIAVFL